MVSGLNHTLVVKLLQRRQHNQPPGLRSEAPKGRIQGQDPGLGSKDEPEEKDPGE